MTYNKKVFQVLLTNIFIVFIVGSFHFNVLGQRRSQPSKTTRILFVLDASGSMRAEWEGATRMEIAQKVLSEQLNTLRGKPNLEVGLRVYGHQFDRAQQNCTDSKLEVPFGVNNFAKIAAKLETIAPKGTTPIAYSLEKAANDFPEDRNTRNVIIMITDGIESCNGDPCAISIALQKKNIFLRPFVIGLGLELKYQKAFECMGRFYNAESTAQFEDIIQDALQQTLGRTTITVELQNQNGMSVERNVNMSFINTVTGETIYDYVHYRDERDLTDTLEVDAILTYDLVVNTVPPVVKKNIVFKGGRHNTVPLKTPQGTLSIIQQGAGDYSNALQAIVRKSGEMRTLITHRVGTEQRYLIGTYDLEILTRPRTYIRDVRIEQGKTKKLVMPSPGVINVVNRVGGYGSVYLINDDGSQRWVYNFEGDKGQQNIVLQPGRYKIVFRPKDALGSQFTKTKIVELREGESKGVDLLR